MEHYNVTFLPEGRQISIHAGATLLEAAGQAGIILNSVCGGRGTCKKCAVKLQPGEQQVLACQHRVQKDITVKIPPGSRFFAQKILSSGIDTKTEVRPDIYENYKETASSDGIFGMAVDIGTTTVVAKLVDMVSGQCLATLADLNPQSRYGSDVISRISYARTDARLTELHETITDCINGLTAELCSRASIDAEQLYEMCIVGNTTMNHIFLKFPVAQLGQAPYKPFSIDAKDTVPDKLKLRMNPVGNVHAAAGIAGFVGSDITAVALAVGIESARDLTLVVDIGTNGEIVLGTGDKLYAASCAAGPALEGARISCGSRAAEGAIEAVFIDNNDIGFDVIDGSPPRSICGSGLIDAVAVLLDLAVLDSTGRFTDPGKLPPTVASRICDVNDQPAFRLADNVILTQQDIREVQLAKAAVRSGIKLLLKKIGVEDNDIKQIFLAGAFGNYIRRESALRIGLLPSVPLERIHFVGNAASSGAQMLLIDSRLRKLAGRLSRKMEYVEIAREKDFESVFTDSMSFQG